MPVDLDYARARAARCLADHMQAAADRVIGAVCPAEVASWPSKEAAVRGLDNGALSQEDADLLDDEAGRKGITREAVARGIQRRRLVFRRTAVALTAGRDRLDKALPGASTEEQVDAALASSVQAFDASFAAALTAAQAEVAARGLLP